MSLLVPVFTAVQKRVASGLSSPKVGLRLSRSERMLAMTNAAAAEYSLTRRAGRLAPARRRSGRHTPPLARVR